MNKGTQRSCNVPETYLAELFREPGLLLQQLALLILFYELLCIEGRNIAINGIQHYVSSFLRILTSLKNGELDSDHST